MSQENIAAVPRAAGEEGPQALSVAFFIFFLSMKTDKNPPPPHEGKRICPGWFQRAPIYSIPSDFTPNHVFTSPATSRRAPPPTPSLCSLLIRARLLPGEGPGAGAGAGDASAGGGGPAWRRYRRI